MHSDIMMKKICSILLIGSILMATTVSATGCKTKEGCGLEDKYKANLNSKKKGKSNLFSKKQRKKMR